MRKALLVFNNDFRVDDQPLLNFAADNEMASLGVVFLGQEKNLRWHRGAASNWWLHHSLEKFRAQLAELGVPLILSEATASAALKDLIEKYGITDLLTSRNYDQDSVKRERWMDQLATKLGIEFHSFNSRLLWEPWEIKSQESKPYQVFTAFWKQGLRLDEVSRPRSAPKKIRGLAAKKSELGDLDSLNLHPKEIRWDKEFPDYWNPGASSAQKAMKAFLKNVAEYEEARNIPSRPGTSRMSPHLHFGEISPRRLWHEIKTLKEGPGRECYLRELGWREFSHHLIFHFPDTDQKPLRRSFDRFNWVRDPKALKRWQQGMTGYPIIDAGMRELWRTGWMHNRVRMIVGSFLVKDLRISWLEGAHWFWDTLVDADLAANSMGWQWIGGCGADAAPYFRVFNPMTQSEKFDAKGEYIRKWVPELAGLSNDAIHAPWEQPEIVLRAAGVILGKDYPEPMVDHKVAREAALAAFKNLKA